MVIHTQGHLFTATIEPLMYTKGSKDIHKYLCAEFRGIITVQ